MSDDSIGNEMYSAVKRLFPICRSLTGDGVRASLDILREIAPIVTEEVPSGTQVFDWQVPPEWNVRDAYVADAAGHRIIDFQKCNLHLVGYSEPFEGQLSLAELNQHLYSLPEQPDVIPYVTSYYARRWGFCLNDRQRQQLTEQAYFVKIDSTLETGSMTIGDLIIPGETEQEVLLSTYLCHPSMANNELSGPVVSAFLARELLQKPRRFTYRFVFVPETIGSITYLANNLQELKKRVIAGYVLTCLGNPGAFSYLETRLANTLVDRVTAHIFKYELDGSHWYSFLDRGSDERQYNWPGIDLPVGSLMRTKYGEYPEYHTSADNLDLVTPAALAGSLKMCLRCLNILEDNRTYRCTVLCEPQLGRRGLYPTLSSRASGLQARDLVNILAYSDGKTDLLAIAEKLRKPLWELQPLVRQLLDVNLLEEVSGGLNGS